MCLTSCGEPFRLAMLLIYRSDPRVRKKREIQSIVGYSNCTVFRELKKMANHANIPKQ